MKTKNFAHRTPTFPLSHFLTCLLTLFLLAASVSTARAAEDLSTILQRGLFEEEANHNLPAAIKAYEAVVAATDAQRKLAGTALFRLAECQRKLGRTNDAVSFYQRVLREYPDQTRLADLSREYLAGLGASAGAGNAAPALSQSARAEQKRLLEEEIKIVEKDLQRLDALRKAGTPDHAAVSTKQRELLALRMNVAKLGLETVGEASRQAAGAPTDEEDKEVRRIQALIKDSPDLINTGGQNGATPLHTAASKGQLVVARFLLENKANVNARNRTGETPLHEAVRNGHKSMTELLLANAADLNAVASGGGTPLHYAASRGYKAIVEVLLANKANPNALNENQSAPLHVALTSGYDSVAELLLQAGTDVNTIEKYPGIQDTHSHSIGTPLHIAIGSGKKLLAEKILARGADVSLRNQFGDTPLHVVGNSVELAALLVAAKADVNARIREEGNELSRTPLALAVTRGHADMVEFLLKNGADPNLRFRFRSSSDEYSPLAAAVHWDKLNNRERIVAALLEHKADPNAKSIYGFAPLHLSLNSGRPTNILELLLKHGADVEVRDRNGGNTPLCFMLGGRENIELLLDHKANPNAQNNEGNTPLHRLVEKTQGNERSSSQEELAELLIARGADVNLRNKQGLTPLNLYGVPARPGYSSGEEMVEVLRKHGAKDEQQDIMADADSIRVWRKGMTVGRVVFVRDEAGRNRYTLIEALMNFYSMRHTPLTMAPPPAAQPGVANPPASSGGVTIVGGAAPQLGGSPVQPRPIRTTSPGQLAPFQPPVMAFGGVPAATYDPLNEIPFPDLTRIRILRTADGAKGEKKVISVNLINAAGIVLCANDVLLEFGDIIEIPEREYRLDEGRIGLSGDQQKQFNECMLRRVQVVMKGESTEVQLLPHSNIAYLAPVMRSTIVRKVLRSTSDLSRLRIIRRADPAINQSAMELTLDLEAFQRSGKQQWDDLWLRDGDVIEVQERE